MNRKRKINRKYMQMQTVGVFLLTLVVVLAVTWEINLNQVKREKLKASYTAESTVSRVESQLSKYLTESDMVKRMLEKGYTLDKKRFDSLAELMQENEDVIEARELAEVWYHRFTRWREMKLQWGWICWRIRRERRKRGLPWRVASIRLQDLMS